MDRPRLIRGLRIAWTVVFGILCVLLIVLGVRSYWYRDGMFRYSTRFVAILSECGDIVFQTFRDSTFKGTTFWDMDTRPNPTMSTAHLEWLIVKPPFFHLRISYWYPVLTTGIFAAAPWIQWSQRFSLRTLLIATTLIAVVLATVAYLRLW